MKLSGLAYLVELDEGWNKMFTAQAQLEKKQRRGKTENLSCSGAKGGHARVLSATWLLGDFSTLRGVRFWKKRSIRIIKDKVFTAIRLNGDLLVTALPRTAEDKCPTSKLV